MDMALVYGTRDSGLDPAESFIDKDFSFVFWATQQRDPGTFFIYFALSVFVIQFFEILNLTGPIFAKPTKPDLV
jgi:hypothetical protein